MALNVEVLNFGEDDGSLINTDSLDPNFHYRFIQNRPNRVARARKQGYKPVLTTDENAPELTSDSDESTDGLIRDGDRILMSVPKERKTARERQTRKLQNQRMKAPVSGFKKKVKGAESKLGKRIRTTTSKEEKI